jgi:hypothetical protein
MPPRPAHSSTATPCSLMSCFEWLIFDLNQWFGDRRNSQCVHALRRIWRHYPSGLRFAYPTRSRRCISNNIKDLARLGT